MHTRIIEEKTEKGIILFLDSDENKTAFELTLKPFDVFLSAYRNTSCWMTGKTGDKVSQIPDETQYLLTKKDNVYTLYLFLAITTARSSLYLKNSKTFINIETGDTKTPIGKSPSVYIISGNDPYEIIDRGTKELSNIFHTFALKKDKKIPDFIDYFGFCTYNAFYSDCSEKNITSVEEAFKKEGRKIGFIIADDGWQSASNQKLTGFGENKNNFPNGIDNFIKILKSEYGLHYFLCWHAYNGYWLGIDPTKFSKYKTTKETFNCGGKEATQKKSTVFNTVGTDFYPSNIYDVPCDYINGGFTEFYDDYYCSLSKKGVNGSKLDAMTWCEAFAQGKGGRVAVMKDLIHSLEKASFKYFDGNHINCSSCSNDFFDNLLSGTVVRTSSDYSETDDSSHDGHIYANGIVGMFTEPVAIADWDMFQSGKTAGDMHAAARAISGGPIYCADNLDTLDFSILKKLALKDGSVKRPLNNLRPVESCLFDDINEAEKPFVFFNKESHGIILAAFNLYGKSDVAGKIDFSSFNFITYSQFAVYSSKKGYLGNFTKTDNVETKLSVHDFEIFTIAPIHNGLSVIGDIDKYNCLGYIKDITFESNKIVCSLYDNGTLCVIENGKAKIYENTKIKEIKTGE